MGSSSADKTTLIQRFASSQVKHYGAKMGIKVKDPHVPLTHITISSDNILHGWNVQVQNNSQRKITYTKSMTVFAESMKGVMKVHSVLIKTMRDPEVLDHN